MQPKYSPCLDCDALAQVMNRCLPCYGKHSREAKKRQRQARRHLAPTFVRVPPPKLQPVRLPDSPYSELYDPREGIPVRIVRRQDLPPQKLILIAPDRI